MRLPARGPSPPTSNALPYLPQLDAIRAFAVSLVLWSHWCAGADDPLGPIGVWIFFVLSGFLITRILLHARRDTPRANRGALLNFYVRRFLRIFPLYYFVLLLALLFSVTFRASWYWYATYLQNFKMIFAGDPARIFGVHLWTLAVEEQFYFTWPLIVLFLPRRGLHRVLPGIIFAAIAIAIASRCICSARGWTDFQAYVFTPNNLDTLACGALLACFTTYRADKVRLLRRLALVAGMAILIAAWLVRVPIVRAATMALPTGLIALWFLSHAAVGFRGLIGRAMLFPTSVYLGRISYGIYIYHFFVPGALAPMLRHLHIADGSVWSVAIYFVVTVAVSSLSWIVLERPINSLKSRFPSRAAGATPIHLARSSGKEITTVDGYGGYSSV